MNADRCTPLQSHWLQTAIRMCDGSLAIWFKDGSCCHFPRTAGGAWYNRIVAAGSPGKWLHQNLYRILPYRRIRPPCPPAGCGVTTPCCANALPTTLHATTPAGSFPIAYDGVSAWVGTGAMNAGHNITLTFQCSSSTMGCNGFSLSVHWPDGCQLDGSGALQTCTCSPLDVLFLISVGPLCGGTGGNQNIEITL